MLTIIQRERELCFNLIEIISKGHEQILTQRATNLPDEGHYAI